MISLFKSASFWAIIGTGLRVGGGLITLPIALREIPQDEMGLYYTFVGITGLAVMLDFGFAPTIARNAAYAIGGAISFAKQGVPEISEAGDANWSLLNQLKIASQRWYVCLGCALAVVLLLGGGLFVDRQIKAAGLSESLLWCWFLFAGTAAYSFTTSYWQDLLMGIGQVASSARIGMISQCIGLILLLFGLLLGLGLWAYAMSTLASSLLGRILCRRAFMTSIPASGLPASSVDLKSVFGSLWPMAWRQGLVTVGAYFIIRGNTLVCSETLGLNETGRYGLTLNILTLVYQVIAVPLMMAWPKIGQLRIKRENRQIFIIFMTRAYGGLLFAIISIACLALWGPSVLKIIGAKSTLLPTFPFLLFAGVLWLEHHHSMYAGLVLSENENPFIIQALVSGVLIFLISWWSASVWGVVGLIATQGAVQLCWNNWWTVVRGLRTLR